ncbi:hypothetical protein F5884DRAFT_320150 [Xylogone sp. PMI_703]|nr:hypothetical protein F5884DRAFT_320150 [Xylogone sp. PMI_703]
MEYLAFFSPIPRYIRIFGGTGYSILQTSDLDLLPPEIIRRIASFLPPESAAICSVTCQYLYNILGNQYLKPLRKEGNADTWYPFSVLLKNNSPNLVACYECKRFHRISTTESFRRLPQKSLCCVCPIFGLSEEDFRISFALCCMAMKRHRLGQDNSEILKLLSPRNLQLHDPPAVQWTQLCTRINATNLFIRRQTIFTPAPTIIGEDDPLILWSFNICPHMEITQDSWTTMACMQRLEPFKRVGGINPPGKGENRGLLQCEFCQTEFRVDYVKLEGEVASMLCTVWQNLGCCESYLDPQWQNHLLRDDREPVEFEPGSICAAFEEVAEFKFNEVIAPVEKHGLGEIERALHLGYSKQLKRQLTCF